MSNSERKNELMHFFEEVGLLFEKWNLPRMAGRVLGCLMVCDPPYQSAAQLAEMLGTSKGSISTMSRLLIKFGLIERLGLPGQRITFYRLSADPIAAMMQIELDGMRTMQDLFERGLKLLYEKSHKQRERLHRSHELLRFLEKELSGLVERFQQESPNSNPTKEKL